MMWLSAGRVQTILIMRLTGVSCLFLMGLHPALWRVTWFIVPIVLLRSGALLSRNSQPDRRSSEWRMEMRKI